MTAWRDEGERDRLVRALNAASARARNAERVARELADDPAVLHIVAARDAEIAGLQANVDRLLTARAKKGAA